MQRKILYALLAILALGLLIYAPSLVRREAPPPPETDRPADRDRRIASLDTAAVRELVIRRDEEEDLTLARRNGDWRVGDRPARGEPVSSLLALLADLEASGIAPPEEAAAADFASPRAVLDVFSLDEENDIIGRTLSLSLRFAPREDEADPWLVRRADEERVFELPAAVARRLLPSRRELDRGGGAPGEEGW